jgi:hypothetical protein
MTDGPDNSVRTLNMGISFDEVLKGGFPADGFAVINNIRDHDGAFAPNDIDLFRRERSKVFVLYFGDILCA